MNQYHNIIQQYFASLENFNRIMSVPRDFGTGDLLFSSEIHTLVAISADPGINMTDLAAKMGVSKSAIAKFVKKLLQKKLIHKTPAPDNKKEVNYLLTEKGTTAVQGHQRFDQEMFGNIISLFDNMTPAQLQFLEKFLTDLNQGIGKRS